MKTQKIHVLCCIHHQTATTSTEAFSATREKPVEAPRLRIGALASFVRLLLRTVIRFIFRASRNSSTFESSRIPCKSRAANGWSASCRRIAMSDNNGTDRTAPMIPHMLLQKTSETMMLIVVKLSDFPASVPRVSGKE